ncbi:NAD-dependent epimerase/dehydratase family protein, partial [Nocardia sp. NPDC004722]
PRSVDPDLPVYDRSKWQGEIELRKVIDDGLDAVVCNPTGVYGPIDNTNSRINCTLWDAARGRVPVMISGGFDLVDVRDVAQGLILASERGRTGENYLLGGHFTDMFQATRTAAEVNGKMKPAFAIPAKVINACMPVMEPVAKAFGSDRISRAAMGALLSAPIVEHSKATEELGYRPRPAEQTIRDLVAFYNGQPIEADTQKIA